MHRGFTGVGQVERRVVGVRDEEGGVLAVQPQGHRGHRANGVFTGRQDGPAGGFQKIAHRISSIWRPLRGCANPPASVRFARGRKYCISVPILCRAGTMGSA
ncbi:hypothetical protein G6F35_017399 [Rhizopus arrhizus]|uniref:Uncharacterized protein n=1 Tax=Rhizopus delemar TaxID=936053 RepID=A0A9P6XTN8_9FUNG|nr:hypothetical protein G6F35_017399 [Rhizopus arrhizus]KAG1531681.1 hypothetical protein G6F50_016566 [Rhizopus delemar]